MPLIGTTDSSKKTYGPKDIYIISVVCPLKGFSNGDDGRKATFPVTKIGKTAYSWERCYTGKNKHNSSHKWAQHGHTQIGQVVPPPKKKNHMWL